MTRRVDRFRLYQAQKNLSDRFAEIGARLCNSTISKSRKAGKDFTDRTCDKLLLAFPDLSREWLYHGIGDMIAKPKGAFTQFEYALLEKLDSIEELLRKMATR